MRIEAQEDVELNLKHSANVLTARNEQNNSKSLAHIAENYLQNSKKGEKTTDFMSA